MKVPKKSISVASIYHEPTFPGIMPIGKRTEIRSEAGWAEKFGRYVIVQMDMTAKAYETHDASDAPINLKEVTAFGLTVKATNPKNDKGEKKL